MQTGSTCSDAKELSTVEEDEQLGTKQRKKPCIVRSEIEQDTEATAVNAGSGTEENDSASRPLTCLLRTRSLHPLPSNAAPSPHIVTAPPRITTETEGNLCTAAPSHPTLLQDLLCKHLGSPLQSPSHSTDPAHQLSSSTPITLAKQSSHILHAANNVVESDLRPTQQQPAKLPNAFQTTNQQRDCGATRAQAGSSCFQAGSSHPQAGPSCPQAGLSRPCAQHQDHLHSSPEKSTLESESEDPEELAMQAEIQEDNKLLMSQQSVTFVVNPMPFITQE
ncbi:hypothetical protein BDP27DRAFT_1413022 [Rhodocollybia butyracea]|uniref:Uncharacterized protein n=1 Tax=Rhodocollybia butyracea TaxID=206335 RepID=A0A9P5QCE4_9AGAR|nr:hypothetical protein BDP27DRAFT_1413022 [Rhodocollybia butyracea]